MTCTSQLETWSSRVYLGITNWSWLLELCRFYRERVYDRINFSGWMTLIVMCYLDLRQCRKNKRWTHNWHIAQWLGRLRWWLMSARKIMKEIQMGNNLMEGNKIMNEKNSWLQKQAMVSMNLERVKQNKKERREWYKIFMKTKIHTWVQCFWVNVLCHNIMSCINMTDTSWKQFNLCIHNLCGVWWISQFRIRIRKLSI